MLAFNGDNVTPEQMEDEFEAAATLLSSANVDLSDALKLKFYGLYKVHLL